MAGPTEFLNLLVGLVVIINPVAIAPIFVSLTAGESPRRCQEVAIQGAIASGIIMLVSFLLGNTLLAFLGIDIHAFQIAGGLLLLNMGLSMAQGRNQKHQPVDDRGESIAVVPLALPVTTGPGVISTLIVYASLYRNPVQWLLMAVIIAIATFIIYLSYHFSPTLATQLGNDGLSIVTRISGLILAAFGVKFILVGIGSLLPGLLSLA
ncbi:MULTISPECIES: MarC family protein [unclassified Leptolyngbya]|uniref:MarC family protein n=1 Tax=unclassified Leptolyngbya TaxID=2650499 RepID=UPI001682E71A|nr:MULTISPECIES: MarC family protein [unclassified Leptolyngbya]MBD1911424.1 NAAT family transporter [Leptolyngbya sp. FACHB-8]MBD2159050.1 NAAT family transporter [Leptolyngbya sp. FACHB-16]